MTPAAFGPHANLLMMMDQCVRWLRLIIILEDMGFIGCGMCIWDLVILHSENTSLFPVGKLSVTHCLTLKVVAHICIEEPSIFFLLWLSLDQAHWIAAAAHLNKSGTKAKTASHLTPFTHALHLIELPLSCMWFLGSVGPTENTHSEGENKHLIRTCSCLNCLLLLLQHLDINKVQLIFKVFS